MAIFGDEAGRLGFLRLHGCQSFSRTDDRVRSPRDRNSDQTETRV
jgi:hypothetical protein